MTKLSAGWPAILTKLSAGFSATLCRTSTLLKNQPRSHFLRCSRNFALFAVLLVDCEEWFCILLGSLPSARHAIVCIFFSLEQSRVVDWVVAEVLLHLSWRIQCFEFWLLSAFEGDVDVFFQGDSVVQHYVFFSPPDVTQRISVRFTGVPSWKYRWMASVLSPTGLFKHLFRLVAHSLSFRRSVRGSTTTVLLNHISRDWGDVTVVLVELCWTPRGFHISSTTAVDYPYFPAGIAVRTLLFGRIFAEFEDFGVGQVGDQVLRFFAELVDLLRLAQVLKKWFLVLVDLKLLDQHFDLVLACCVLLLDCR